MSKFEPLTSYIAKQELDHRTTRSMAAIGTSLTKKENDNGTCNPLNK